MKHTPGPWKASANGQIFGGKYNSTTVADTGWCFWTNRLHELMQEETTPDDTQEFLRKNIRTSQANAKLIAAAPDLLETLEHIEKLYQNTDTIINKKNFRDFAVTVHAMAQKAISKANGGD